MVGQLLLPARTSTDLVVLGDEAVALGAIHAGVSVAYGYPGTPATEIIEYLLRYAELVGGSHVSWSANEKTAFEQALGASMAGRRALVTMKHVGLNVAADPFMNSALVSIDGGLVLAVADDPGMHSSQNEQDSRFYADFARVVCLEPANQTEAYEMTREAFDISERFHIPVMVRLATRLAHSRSAVRTGEMRDPNQETVEPDPSKWVLLPTYARRQWRSLQQAQAAIKAYTEKSDHNTLYLSETSRELGVITTGIARNYYLDNKNDLDIEPSHLHIGAYPVPMEKIRALMGHVRSLLVLEEGYPFVERQVRGVGQTIVAVSGKETGAIRPDGELTPDVVRNALGLPSSSGMRAPALSLPMRPPRLCQGCPHADAYSAIRSVLDQYENHLVTSDIGCYTLGILPPYSVGQSCVCMGASIGMAKGAVDTGKENVIAVIGDSTFLHSGTTALMDCVNENTNMTVVILDNEVVAMTGTQPTVLPSSRLRDLVLGIGVAEEHCVVVEAHPKNLKEMASTLRQEVDHLGLSVVISVRECIEAARKRKKQ